MSEQVLPLRVTRSSSPDAVSDVFTPEASPTESQPSAKNFTGGFERHESDIFIAVMGVTGSGKSTLISKCSHLEVPIGHNLQSCTQEVGVYQCHIPGSLANVYLIDTPGFDDTDRSDTEVLREIATWLTDSYVHDIRLDGIVYLHRIDNPRMQGSGRRNLLMFRKLCGDDALKKVVLTTTRWDNVSEQEGSQREQELVTRQEYWGHFVENGSEVFRHHNTQTSAMSLIKRFVASKTSRSGVTLAIQEQMVNHHQALDQTDAGREVQSALLRQQKKFEKILADAHDDMQAALKERDELAQELLREQQEDMNKRIEQINFDREKLKADMEMLQTEKIAEVERKLDKERKANAKLGKLRDKEMQELKKKFRKSQGGGKAKEEELRPPAGWRSSKEFSLSMNSDRYYFLGPNYYTAKLKLGKPDGEFRTKYVSMGANRTWYHHYHRNGRCKTQLSPNLPTTYPSLASHLSSRDPSACPTTVSLGPRGYFYMRTGKAYKYNLPKSIHKGHDAALWADVKRLWLGVDSTYVLERMEGKIKWRLDGNYAGLDKALRSCRACSGCRVKDLALNIDQADGYVVAFTCGKSASQDPGPERDMSSPFREFLQGNGVYIKPKVAGNSLLGAEGGVEEEDEEE